MVKYNEHSAGRALAAQLHIPLFPGALSVLVPSTCRPTSSRNSPMIFPLGQYSHTIYQALVPHNRLPQPTVVVAFQTNCVKWPVSSLKPGSLKLYSSLSSPHSSTQPVTSLHPMARFSPYGPPECSKSHSDPESGDWEPIEERYEDAYSARVWFHDTAVALCSLR
ncbi:hypothetical protein VP1G_10596 [Cytospora mali]|uniref:Uncharacterized protein n=1 Tax=Cytospora mali TaxID=578113 RepID=A0A194UPC9_CYTMA|nr:hypothetical protein VP1G_10596 [Valsa mali var. pyri (nom. inval.)]